MISTVWATVPWWGQFLIGCALGLTLVRLARCTERAIYTRRKKKLLEEKPHLAYLIALHEEFGQLRN